jgi:hypothetical protein
MKPAESQLRQVRSDLPHKADASRAEISSVSAFAGSFFALLDSLTFRIEDTFR